MKRIQDEKNLRGKKVLVRIDIDDTLDCSFPVHAIVPTILYLRSAGAKIILLGHVGRGGASAEVIHTTLSKDIPVTFVRDIVGVLARNAITSLNDGEILLLENVRKDKREIARDDAFARELASLADIYVNDAFAASHRDHASLVGVPKYLPSYAGFQLQKEIHNLSRARKPIHPSLCILGGAKIETKLPLIKKFIDTYDFVFIGGVLANNLFKEQGLEIGDSLISKDVLDLSSLLSNRRVFLPVDVVVENGGKTITRTVENIVQGDTILDAGENTVRMLKEKINEVEYVLWNGPLGKYERGFNKSTEELAEILSESFAHTIVGGGDTTAAIASLHLEEKYSFLSTGGGAMLEFLLKGTLPAIEALELHPSA